MLQKLSINISIVEDDLTILEVCSAKLQNDKIHNENNNSITNDISKFTSSKDRDEKINYIVSEFCKWPG